MFEAQPIALGIILFFLGLGFFLLTLLLLRLVPRLQSRVRTPTPPPSPVTIDVHHEAVLLIHPGGRVTYLNQQAREMFNMWEEEPNLESLARRARPSENFLGLCVGEGQTRFSLNGHFVEGTSYYAPASMNNGSEEASLILVSLRRPQLVIDGDTPLSGRRMDQGQGAIRVVDTATQTFTIFTELSQAMAASLNLDDTLFTILEGVERLIPSDFFEITIWEPEYQHLVPYHLVGLQGLDRHLEKATDRYTVNQGYSGFLTTNHKPLLIKDVSAFRDVRPAVDRQRFPFHSYLGVPLLIAGDLIGTLELASLSADNYTENDLEVLNIISGQAAVAVHNSQLYQQEQQRAIELSGLANLIQAVGALRDPRDLYARLVESIAPLLDVEILGFLVYDEYRHILRGQIPFQGIPAKVIGMYQVPIQPSSPAEAIWRSAEMIVTSVAPEDPRLEALGIHHVAQAAGIRDTVLTPLSSGGNMLGYLQAANQRDGMPFDKDDLRLLAIVAGQAASIIENATLVQEARRRTQRAETLRRIASLTSSAATLDEILKFSILDLARLLQADIAAIFLLDESRGELLEHKGSNFGIPPELSLSNLSRMPLDDPQFPLTVTGSKQQFISEDLSEDANIQPVYQPLVDELSIRSAIDVPLVMRERGIGELLVGSFQPNFFAPGDILAVATAAGQLAAAIEQSTLYSQTDQSLRQRVEHLTALTRISRELNTTLLLEPLLKRVFDEVQRTTRADCGTILLLDVRAPDPDRLAIINEPPTSEQDRGLKIRLYLGDDPGDTLSSLEQIVLESGETLIVADFNSQKGATLLDDEITNRLVPDKVVEDASPTHDGVRSAMIVPIAYQGQIAGLIHLHAKAPNRFAGTEREIGETLAIQAAIAIGNADRYQDQVRRSELLSRRVETLSKLFEVSQALQTGQSLDEALETIAYAIQASTPFETVLISVYDEQDKLLKRVTGAGIPLTTLSDLRSHTHSWETFDSLLKPEFCLGQSYYIPYDRKPAGSEDIHQVTVMADPPQDLAEGNSDQWHPDDLLLIPLLGSSDEPLGMISVDAPRDSQRPDRPTIESIEIFSSQAALIIENQHKLHFLRSQAEKIQAELHLATEAAAQAQSHLPTLLHKDLEQTIAVQHLSQRARRIYAGLDIAEVVSRQDSQANVLAALGRELLTRMEFDVVMVAEPTSGGPQLTYTLGAIPAGVNPVALLGQRNPLRHSLQTGEATLVADLNADSEWRNTPLLRSLGTKSFICLPIQEVMQTEGEHPTTLAAILAINHVQSALFTDDDIQLYSLLARQTAIALQNLDLLGEATRRLSEVNILLDFSRQLGGLDPGGILQSLVDSALHVIPSAQAAMVALWDAQQGCLVPQAASGYTDDDGLLQVLYQPGEGLPGQVFEQRSAQRLDEVDFARHYNLSPENLLRYRNATGGRLPVSSMAIPLIAGASQAIDIPPTGAGGRAEELDNGSKVSSILDDARATPLGVLILDNSLTTSAFTDEDLALITSLVQQTALTLENAGLYQASERRSEQLQALTGAATAITSSLHPEDLVGSMLDPLEAILQYDTGTLWLREGYETSGVGQSGQDKMIVRDARGFADSDQRIGLSVDIEDSALINEMFSTGRPIWVPNVIQDPRFKTISLAEMLADMDEELAAEIAAELEEEQASASAGYEHLSWLGVPLITSGEVIGVIALEKAEANYYTPDDIQVATTFASQAAAGLENARLYQDSVQRALELDRRSQTLTTLNRLSGELSGSLNPDHIFNVAARELAQIISCTSASALTYHPLKGAAERLDYGGEPLQPSGQILLQAEYPPLEHDSDSIYFPGAILPSTPLFDRLAETLGIFNTDDVTQEPELAPLLNFLAEHNTRSLLIIPIASGGIPGSEVMPERRLHGLLLAHNDQTYHFSADEVELARTISNQIAIALQNAHLFDETRSLTEDLELRVQQRTAELKQEHQRSETLLRIITELSASLDLDQVLHSTLHVLKEFVDAEQITILIARPSEKNLHRLASIGHTPEPPIDGIQTPFEIDQGLAGWIITQRQSVMVKDVLLDERWIKLSYDDEKEISRKHRSALGVPLMSGAEALGSLLLFHHEVDHFSMDQLELVQAAANQVAVSVNNAELYRLIRDQAEDLGNMLRSQQIETSRSNAILEAVADGVLVTDVTKLITLFNESAENILGLERAEVVGHSMEHFSGLFGRAARRWMETIETWSQDPDTYELGDTFAERITLEDGRVISVHLAPVSLRNNFLGTVSIFRDITHQVEVDRLKSEFVATVSHELRTPMTSIKGYVDVMLMGAAGELNNQQTDFLNVVKTNTARLAILVNDLLDISQIEAGRAAFTLQPLNIVEIATQAIADLERRSQEDQKPINIDLDVQPEIPRAMGDAERVRQIFDNLLDNAYQYNTPDGQINVRLKNLGDEVQIDIKDSGVGIHPEDQERVFERFFRGENPLVLGVSGTGLGLSIVKYLVEEMHKGRIWVESSGLPGLGSTFSFTLPVYSPKEPDEEPAEVQIEATE